MRIEVLRVEGMRSARDRRLVLGAAEAVPGVRRAQANLADRTLRLECEDGASLAALVEALRGAGYTAAVLV